MSKEENGILEIDSDGTKVWKLNGKFHRLDGPAIIHPNGHKEWYINDKRHRLDGPAVIYSGGNKYWFVNDIQYTEEEFNKLEEVITQLSDEDEDKHQHALLQEVIDELQQCLDIANNAKLKDVKLIGRLYDTIIEQNLVMNITKEEENGKLEINSIGTKRWKLNGKFHRLDGPAVIYSDGNKYWYLNGKQHRLDGPAVIYSDGNKYWFVNDIQYTEEEFNKLEVVLDSIS